MMVIKVLQIFLVLVFCGTFAVSEYIRIGEEINSSPVKSEYLGNPLLRAIVLQFSSFH